MKSEIEDLRCPTCRQRNSRVRKHLVDDGETALVWYCSVPGCSNGPDVPRQAADFHGVHAAELIESLPEAKPTAHASRFAPFVPPFRFVRNCGAIADSTGREVFAMLGLHEGEMFDRIGHAIAAAMNKE